MVKLRRFSVWFVAPAGPGRAAGCGGGDDGGPGFFTRSASK
jgi:hypothetical protein